MRNRSIARQALGEPTLVRVEDEDGTTRWWVRGTNAYTLATGREVQIDTGRPAIIRYGRGYVWMMNGDTISLSLPALFAWVTLIGLDIEGDGALWRVTRVASTDPISIVRDVRELRQR